MQKKKLSPKRKARSKPRAGEYYFVMTPGLARAARRLGYRNVIQQKKLPV
jgi:hypothetical protein